jgi:hypothetical protein
LTYHPSEFLSFTAALLAFTDRRLEAAFLLWLASCPGSLFTLSNSKLMETIDTTTPLNRTASKNRVRLLLTLAGIVTAILCSMTLLQEVRSSKPMNAGVPLLMKSPKIVAVELIGEVKAWI